jgi:hypothetical protein
MLLYAARQRWMRTPHCEFVPADTKPPGSVPTNESESLSLRLVSEARHIWGEATAAELWFKRGLPVVPGMKSTPDQRTLPFEWAGTEKRA